MQSAIEAPASTSTSIVDRVLSPLRLAAGFALTAASSAALVPAAVALLPSRPARIKLCNYYGKLLGPTLINLAGVKPIVRHRERVMQAYPAIYVSNHTSVLDVFFAIWICPVGGCGVAKKEIGNIPFFGWLYRLSGHLLIDRGDREGAIAALAKTAKVVRENNLSIWMWPEGTRSKDGRLLPIKKGLAHLAIATKLPIVPVVLHNAHLNWAKHDFTLHPTTVEVDILEPIKTDHWTLETMEENLAEVHKAFADALGPDQKPLGDKAMALGGKAAPGVIGRATPGVAARKRCVPLLGGGATTGRVEGRATPLVATGNDERPSWQEGRHAHARQPLPEGGASVDSRRQRRGWPGNGRQGPPCPPRATPRPAPASKPPAPC